MQVGFIGLGTMGASMAANLQKAGYALIVHDARREAAARHTAAGARWAETPREVAAATEVMFTSLPGPPEVEAVALGRDGLLAGVRKGAAYFDLSTNARSVVQKIHAAFAGVEIDSSSTFCSVTLSSLAAFTSIRNATTPIKTFVAAAIQIVARTPK